MSILVEHHHGNTVENDTDRVQQAGDFLQVSPYSDQAHLLNLSDVSRPNQLLAKALVELEWVREDYATAGYQESFNWPVVIDHLRGLLRVHNDFQWLEQSFYVVVFKSRIEPGTPYPHLIELDRRSHAEATLSGGLLKYLYGTPDNEGNNLATCVWRSRDDAIKANKQPAHGEAAQATSALYRKWKIERFRLVIGKDAEQWSLLGWNDENQIVL